MIVVTDTPARLDYPSGFSGRMYNFIAALGARWPVDVVALLGTRTQGVCGEVSEHDFVDARLAVRDVIGVDVPALDRAGADGGGPGWLRRQCDPHQLPTLAQPARLPQLRSLIERTDPALVVVHHVLNAHIVNEVPSGTPVVFAFEEGAGEFSRWTEGLDKRDVRQRFLAERERRRERHMYRGAVAKAALCTAISHAEAVGMRRWAPAARPSVIKHGIDCAVFAPHHVDEHSIDVAVVGVMHEEARYRDALAVFDASRRSLAADVRSWRWAFAGRGAEQVAPHLDAHTMCGPVDDVRDVYANARVVIVPTVEGVGVKTTVLEAWAMGRPVVASSRALRDLEIEPDVNVLVADTPEETVEQVRALLAEPARADSIGAEARRTALRHRDIRRLARQFADLCALAVDPSGRESVAPVTAPAPLVA